MSTRAKVRIARGLSLTVRGLRALVGRGPELVARRRGVVWALDLREGIDLAIYLLGGFEVRTLDMYQRHVRPGDVVFDIGANIGAHTLPLAQLAGGEGKVFAFEPTDYAIGKLRRNLALNPGLQSTVTAHQMMVVASDADPVPDSIHSSWPLDQVDGLDAGHCGRLMATTGAGATTLDGFVARTGLGRVNFLKIDVDGNEHEVLNGARETLARHRPTIMIELAPYIYRDGPEVFDAFLEMLFGLGYRLCRVADDSALPATPAGIRACIGEGAGINALAIHSAR